MRRRKLLVVLTGLAVVAAAGVVALQVEPSQNVAGAVILRVFGSFSACLAWFAAVMFFRSW